LKTPTIHTLDLNFQEKSGAIASYLVPWDERAILIETGPTSTLSTLQSGLNSYGYTLDSVSDAFVTHIHLDHAGAAGHLARNGTRIYVHPLGAPHLANPVKLLESARRIYGESMDSLWGSVVGVPEERLRIIEDGEQVTLGPHLFQAMATPGHASHHHVYIYEGICFSGDVGGVRIPGSRNLTLPMPPPDIQLKLWRESVARMRKIQFEAIAPTHFGIYHDPTWQMDRISNFLTEVEIWLEDFMSTHSYIDLVPDAYVRWFFETATDHGLDATHLSLAEIVNPASMSGEGLRRYWKKYRAGETSSE
jgi:glyoxylase-like metal-dependent hydrolase (beta-lactamase superfamily II)